MAAAKLTQKTFRLNSELMLASVNKATQNDWIVFNEAGIVPIRGELATGAIETITRPTLTVNEPVDGYTAAETVIAYDGATANTRLGGEYYVLNQTTGEILYVVSDSGAGAASGNLTVQRGALGTTAAAMANNEVLTILSAVILGSVTLGKTTLLYACLSEDPGVGMVVA